VTTPKCIPEIGIPGSNCQIYLLFVHKLCAFHYRNLSRLPGFFPFTCRTAPLPIPWLSGRGYRFRRGSRSPVNLCISRYCLKSDLNWRIPRYRLKSGTLSRARRPTVLRDFVKDPASGNCGDCEPAAKLPVTRECGRNIYEEESAI